MKLGIHHYHFAYEIDILIKSLPHWLLKLTHEA